MPSKRKCTLCPSHIYEYCPSCKDKKIIEPWRLLFDSENCRDAYHIISEFAFGRLSANEAKSQLDKIDVPNKEDMQPALRKNLEDLYAQSTINEQIKQNDNDELTLSPTLTKEKEDMEFSIPRRRRRIFNRNYD